MNKTDEQVFSLLRYALWGSEINLELFDENTDWQAILSMAHKQTIAGCVIDGMTSLPRHLLPKSELLMKSHLFLNKCEQYNELLNDVIKDICGRLDNAGIRSILLKGQGMAQNYPNPKRRSCGDIDLYLGKENYALTIVKLKEWGILKTNTKTNILHLHFKYRGVPVEIHKIAGLLYSPTGFFRFKKWSENMLQGKNGTVFPCRKAEFNGQTVLLPPVQFDSLFVFSHLYGHLVSGGIGLRQVVDFTMYLHRFKDEINLDKLHKDLKSMGLLRPWKTFGHIVTRYLGLPVEEYPFYDSTYSETGDFILHNLILKHGNFGFYEKDRGIRPSGYFSGKLYSLKNMIHYICITNKAFGTITNINYMTYYTIKGLGNIMGDTIKKIKKQIKVKSK